MTPMNRGAAIRPLRAHRSKAFALVASAIMIGAAACGGSGSDSTTGPTQDYSGVYTLQSIDRVAPPIKYFDGSARDATTGTWHNQFILTIRSGTLELDAQGRYHSTYAYTLVEDGATQNRVLRAQGTYEVSGGRIFLLRDTSTDRGQGIIKPGEVTLYLTLMDEDENRSFVFRKG